MRNLIWIFLFSILLIPLFQIQKSLAQVSGERTLIPEIKQDNRDTRVFYSVFVQSFYDSNSDGIGDLAGLTGKLEYLKELGIGGIWMLPVHPSPTYHKYDVVDYYDIHDDYGTIIDYKELVRRAHELDMLVILDLVANHTSNKNQWFIKAASGNKKYRDYYIWSDNKDDFEKEPFHWHQVRKENGQKENGERYYGFFWWEMPDLNYDNPAVREEIIKIGKFWLAEIGVDGFRLDAAEHIYPPAQKDKTLAWWKEFKDGISEVNPDAIVIGEIWGGSEFTGPYLENGITAGFNFELADTIKKSVLEGRDLGIVQTLNKIHNLYEGINPDFDDATFLSNHDMDRIMTYLNRDPELAKISAALLLTLPGNPVIYYGEEIGMLGEKPDEYIREPFLWNIEGQDAGQTNWEIPYASSSATVKPLIFQTDDHSSIFNTYKTLINLRNNSPALRKGHIQQFVTGNPAVVAYFRTDPLQEALVIINLSSSMQKIKTPAGLDGYELAYSNYGVFKISDKEINLQPHGIFILTRQSSVFNIR